MSAIIAGLILAGALAVAAYIGLRIESRPQRAIVGPAPVADEMDVRPALVHFALTNCDPGTAAYEATILDLAARGFLAAESRPDGLWISYAESPAESAGVAPLTASEQRVLSNARAALTNAGSASLVALGNVCRGNVTGTWDPFETELRAEARSLGLCERRLVVTARTLALATGLTLAACAFAVIASLSPPRGSVGAAVFGGSSTAAVFTWVLVVTGRRDRLTARGAALLASWESGQQRLATEPAGESVRQLAFATAASLPGTDSPEPVRVLMLSRRKSRVRADRPRATRRPAEVWSSFSGTWRLIRIRNARRLGLGRGAITVGAGLLCGVVTYFLAVSASAGAWTVVPMCTGISLLTAGMSDMIRVGDVPDRADLDGQVIARWQEGEVTYVAIDDGGRAWTFSGSVAGQLAIGDLVGLTINPRSGKLIGLALADRSAAGIES